MVDEKDIPELLRTARLAMLKQDFAQASQQYSIILTNPEMQKNIDLKAQYAFCLEKKGHLAEAIKQYHDVVVMYLKKKEMAAAKALDLKISVLRSLLEQKQAKAKKPTRVGVTTQMNKAATVDFAKFLALGTSDLSSHEEAQITHDITAMLESDSARNKDKESILNFTHFLSLGTVDFDAINQDKS